jgi:hypothetical protein
MNLNGQWTGEYSGTNKGLLVVELDDVEDQLQGTAVAIDYDLALPATECELFLSKGQDKFTLSRPFYPVDRNTCLAISPADFEKRYPGVTRPTKADIECEIVPPRISIKWKTDIGTSGECTLARGDGGKPSTLEPIKEVTDWSTFKNYATELPSDRFIFRGQEKKIWRLRTAFHRTDRASLRRFLSIDVKTLHRNLSGMTSHRFDLTDGLDYAAFLALVQHHGYPTPVLDWTRSPFIAAYFAFRNLDPTTIAKDDRVRIHVLDGKAWNMLPHATAVSPAFLHMTIVEPLAINNVRVVPQQSVSVVTNVEDLETHIQRLERIQKWSFLKVIDLPAEERSKVIRELDLMGINAGSLFPGLDGACRQLKERFFG